MNRPTRIVPDHAERLLTPHEVAALFKVDHKTVQKWVRTGKLEAIRTPGNSIRIRETVARQALEGTQ